MLEITKHNRDELVRYLDNSKLPHSDVKALCQMLMSLKEVKSVEEEPKADESTAVEPTNENEIVRGDGTDTQ